jgi:hypothetical protein
MTAAGTTVPERVVDAVREQREAERRWAERSASRVRRFVPERVHVPKHRADVVSDG